jgi:hypothetical protein
MHIHWKLLPWSHNVHEVEKTYHIIDTHASQVPQINWYLTPCWYQHDTDIQTRLHATVNHRINEIINLRRLSLTERTVDPK